MKRRSPWHNYRLRGTYMLTLVVEGRKTLLGRLVANNSAGAKSHSAKQDGTVAAYSAERNETAVYVERTELGKIIETEEIEKIHLYYPQVEVWKLCIMPDHMHVIVRVNEDMPKGKTLGTVVAGFKSGCNNAYWALFPKAKLSGTVAQEELGETMMQAKPEGTKAQGLFEAGYNDKILMHEGQLDNWKAYLDENPYRLWVKRQNPQAFTVLHDWVIGGKKCQIVGNRFLLDIPDKVAVIVHRRYTDEENARLRQEWLECGERGGVLVSAAIAPKEKAVLREAMDRGYRIILLRENGFPPLYKPSGEAFFNCAAGLLLQISPWDFHMERKTITREQCLELNQIAESIAGEI